MALVTIPIDSLSVTNDSDQDVLELIAGATWPFKLVSFELESDCTTDERVKLRLVRGRSSTGSGGSAITPSQVEGTSTVHTSVNSLVTAPGSGGTVIRGWRWSQLNKLQYIPLPKNQIVVPAATRLSLHLNSAVGSTRLWSGEMVIDEQG